LSREDVDEDEFDLEQLTDGDVVTAMIEEFRRFSPGAAAALIDERDAFIAYRLIALRNAGHDVVAVVGAGHREGIERYLADPDSLPPADSLVGKAESSRTGSILYKAIGYAICEPQLRLGRRRHDGHCDECGNDLERYAAEKLKFPLDNLEPDAISKS
jgi:pheromone shutdown protein TraB